MRRPAVLRVAVSMVVVLIVGAIVLVNRGLANKEDQPVRFGVLADREIGKLRPGKEVCQAPLDLDRPVRRIGLAVDTAARPGPPLLLTIRDLDTDDVLRTVRVPGGYRIPLKGFVTVPLGDPVAGGKQVSVCAENLARRGSLSLVGNPSIRASEARIGRRALDGDWAIFFPIDEGERRNLLQMVPDVLRRASVLRPGFVTPAFYVVLAILIFGVGPVLLARGVLSADDEDQERAADPDVVACADRGDGAAPIVVDDVAPASRGDGPSAGPGSGGPPTRSPHGDT